MTFKNHQSEPFSRDIEYQRQQETIANRRQAGENRIESEFSIRKIFVIIFFEVHLKKEDEIDRREIIRKNRQRLRASHQRRKLARIEDVESRRRDYEKSVKGQYDALRLSFLRFRMLRCN